MNVAIIDYGSGNLRSAAKAFERAAREGAHNVDIVVTSRAAVVADADRVVLPGVGAFGDCRRGVEALPGMLDALQEAVHVKARPFLGICVGMQLMADRGLEHGEHPGFGWIPGTVGALTPSDPNLKVPHMGWNDLRFTAHAAKHPVLKALGTGCHAYFVHGFGMRCDKASTVLAEVDYAGPITAIIGRDNMVGTQFHPEKSQDVGLRLIANFLAWKP
jgi:imidazole glycerol-phosphate synthase subunit HisH